MRKFISLVAVILSCSALSAQYMCTTKGAVLTYSETNLKENQEITTTAKVVEVNTDADGTVSNRVEYKHPVPDKPLASVTTYESSVFNPATDVTAVTLMSGDDFKNLIVTTAKEEIESAGQYVSEAQMKEITDHIQVKGDIILEINAKAAPDSKIPNKTLRLNMATMNFTLNLWEAKYLGTETVEVPAGKFEDCAKVIYTLRTTNPQGSEKERMIAWYVKNLGLVKMQSVDKKGNVENEQLLKSVKNPE